MLPHFVRAQGCLQRSTDAHVHHICRHTNTGAHNCMHAWTRTLRWVDCFLSYSTILCFWADSPHSDCATVALHNTFWISTGVVHFSVVWLLHHRAQYYIPKQPLGKLPLSQRWRRRLTGIKNPLTWRLSQFSFICCEHSRVKNLCSCFIHIVFDWKHKFILHSLWLKTQVRTALQLVSLRMLWVASYLSALLHAHCQIGGSLLLRDHHPKPWAEKERKSLHSDFSQRHRQLCLILIKDTTSLCKWFV